MSRWVRISASIFETEAFEPAPFGEREAWVWMIINAAWKDTVHRVGNKVVEVPVGTFFTTLRALRDAWNWKSDTRVRAFLKVLEAQRMISTETASGKTQIVIRNYKKYQCVGSEEYSNETQEKRKKNADRTQEKRTKDTSTPIHQIDISSSEEIRIAPSGNEKEAFEAFLHAIRGTQIPEPKRLTKDRSVKLNQRLKEHGIDGWREACRKIASSDFCRGKNDKGWVADFDFMLQPSSLNRLVEGRYDNRVIPIQHEKARERTPLDVIKERLANAEHGGATIDHFGGNHAGHSAPILLNAFPERR